MADEFKYSAELELDIATFARSAQEADKNLKRLADSGAALDSVFGEKLEKSLSRFADRGKQIETSLKAGGAAAQKAAQDLKTYNKVLESANRSAANFLGKGSPTARKGLMTFAEKDEANQARKAAQEKAAIQREEVARQKDYERQMVQSEKTRIAAQQKVRQEELSALRRDMIERTKARQDEAYATYSPNIAAAQNAKEAAKAQEDFVNSLSNTRYALYDLATTMTLVSAATLGLSGAAVGVSATFEREFADVQRTSEGSRLEIDKLRQSLVDLTTQMPTDFTDVANIATLGGQLGIATENIDDFSRTVSMFAATTDVSVDAAAQGFGRLAQLTKIPQDEIRNLGSAIYETGVQSVATESAILSVAQQIAVSGQLAGFSADQIIGLASALASLGVAPEAARGSTMRIFANITTAVDEGGAALDKFAQISQMSAQEFANAWRNDPQAAFSALVEGFSRTADSGGNLVGLLKDLGIGAVRDQRALLLLADNTEVYNQALSDSASAYADATSLQEGYGVVAETLVSKLQVFLNTLKAILAQGLNPMVNALQPVIDKLQWLANAAKAFAETRFGSVLMSAAAGFAGFIGLVALGVAGFTRLFAAVASAITGLNGWIDGTRRAETGHTRLNTALMGTIKAMTTLSAQARAGAVSWTGYGTALGVAGTAMTRAKVAGTALFGMLRANLATGALLAGIWALNKAFSTIYETINKTNIRKSDIFGDTEGLKAAIDKDTEAMHEGADAFRTFKAEIEDSNTTLAPWAGNLGEAIDAQVELTSATAEATENIRTQTLALGENAQAFLANQLANNEGFQKFYKDYGAALEAAGVDLQEALRRALSEDGGGTAYFDEMIAKITAARDEIEAAATRSGGAFTDMQHAQISALNEQLTALRAARSEFAATDSFIQDQISNIEATSAAYSAMGADASLAAGQVSELDEQVSDLAEGMFDSINAVAGVSESLYNLHESLIENGKSFDVYTENGRANMEALQRSVEALSTLAQGDMQVFGQGLANIFAHLESAGAAATPEIDFLRQQLVNTFNQQYGLNLDISDAMGSIQDFIDAAITALQVRAELERSRYETKQTNVSRVRSNLGAFAERTGRSIGFGGKSNSLFSPNGIEIPWERTEDGKNYQQQMQALENLKGSVATAGREGQKAGQAIRRGMEEAGGGAKKATKAAKETTKAAKEAQEEMYSLVDYASDLSSISDRAFDIRFGSRMAQDDTSDMLKSMRDNALKAALAVRDARQAIKELRADLKSLSADRKILQYQLGVAVEYGDDLRAAEIRAELAKNSAEAADKSNDLSDAQKDLKKAQSDSSRELVGNSAAARRNRDEVLKLVQSYQQEIFALASSGASKATLERRTKELRAEFVRQLTQMGYNRREVERYAKAFGDLSSIIRKVPRKINVSANTNPATQALNEWIRRNRNRKVNVKANLSGLPKNVGGGTYRPSRVSVGSGGLSTPRVNVGSQVSTPTVKANKFKIPGWSVVRTSGNRFMMNPLAKGGIAPEYHATGGVHGLHPGSPMGTDTTPAWLTPGEFVQRKKAVDHYGVPFMNALNNLKIPKYYAGGGGPAAASSSSSSGIQPVELLPHQLRAIVNALRVDVNIGNQQVAAAATAGNARQAGRGAN